MKTFILYGTSACHLCEVAQSMIEAQCGLDGDVDYRYVDISESDDLFQRYGLLIPVLQHPDQRELGWPFSEAQLLEFMAL